MLDLTVLVVVADTVKDDKIIFAVAVDLGPRLLARRIFQRQWMEPKLLAQRCDVLFRRLVQVEPDRGARLAAQLADLGQVDRGQKRARSCTHNQFVHRVACLQSLLSLPPCRAPMPHAADVYVCASCAAERGPLHRAEVQARRAFARTLRGGEECGRR